MIYSLDMEDILKNVSCYQEKLDKIETFLSPFLKTINIEDKTIDVGKDVWKRAFAILKALKVDITYYESADLEIDSLLFVQPNGDVDYKQRKYFLLVNKGLMDTKEEISPYHRRKIRVDSIIHEVAHLIALFSNEEEFLPTMLTNWDANLLTQDAFAPVSIDPELEKGIDLLVLEIMFGPRKDFLEYMKKYFGVDHLTPDNVDLPKLDTLMYSSISSPEYLIYYMGVCGFINAEFHFFHYKMGEKDYYNQYIP